MAFDQLIGFDHRLPDRDAVRRAADKCVEGKLPERVCAFLVAVADERVGECDPVIEFAEYRYYFNFIFDKVGVVAPSVIRTDIGFEILLFNHEPAFHLVVDHEFNDPEKKLSPPPGKSAARRAGKCDWLFSSSFKVR